MVTLYLYNSVCCIGINSLYLVLSEARLYMIIDFVCFCPDAVIGQKVNMAARLMMKFPSCVTCDETTKSKSNLPEGQFTMAPPVTLKGISNPENIYTFSTEK